MQGRQQPAAVAAALACLPACRGLPASRLPTWLPYPRCHACPPCPRCLTWASPLPRLQVDPSLSRTVVVSTKLDTRIPQFARPHDVEMYLRPPSRLLEPTMLGGSPFFTCAGVWHGLAGRAAGAPEVAEAPAAGSSDGQGCAWDAKAAFCGSRCAERQPSCTSPQQRMTAVLRTCCPAVKHRLQAHVTPCSAAPAQPPCSSVPSGRVGNSKDAIFRSNEHFREAVADREAQVRRTAA